MANKFKLNPEVLRDMIDAYNTSFDRTGMNIGMSVGMTVEEGMTDAARILIDAVIALPVTDEETETYFSQAGVDNTINAVLPVRLNRLFTPVKKTFKEKVVEILADEFADEFVVSHKLSRIADRVTALIALKKEG